MTDPNAVELDLDAIAYSIYEANRALGSGPFTPPETVRLIAERMTADASVLLIQLKDARAALAATYQRRREESMDGYLDNMPTEDEQRALDYGEAPF